MDPARGGGAGLTLSRTACATCGDATWDGVAQWRSAQRAGREWSWGAAGAEQHAPWLTSAARLPPLPLNGAAAGGVLPLVLGLATECRGAVVGARRRPAAGLRCRRCALDSGQAGHGCRVRHPSVGHPGSRLRPVRAARDLRAAGVLRCAIVCCRPLWPVLRWRRDSYLPLRAASRRPGLQPCHGA